MPDKDGWVWLHLLLSATTEPFLLVVIADGGEVGPLVRGLSEDDLAEPPAVEDDATAELVVVPPDCFTEWSSLSWSSFFHISSRSLSCFFSLCVRVKVSH